MKDSSRKGSEGRSIVAPVIGFLTILLIVGMACGLPSTVSPTSNPSIYTMAAQTIVSMETMPALPEFPWPPPKPSTRASLTLGSLRQTGGSDPTFHDVDARISQALTTAGYDEKSYYGVPNGFAIITRLEHIDVEGYPDPSDRWVSSLKPIDQQNFSLRAYLAALFGAPKGYYRVFVFIVTSNMVVQSGTPVTQGQAQTWFIEGANKLPSEMEVLPYTQHHTSTVYIYQFVQSGIGESANQNIPSSITSRQHLERAGLWASLEE